MKKFIEVTVMPNGSKLILNIELIRRVEEDKREWKIPKGIVIGESNCIITWDDNLSFIYVKETVEEIRKKLDNLNEI
jgi:hypothetical protein